MMMAGFLFVCVCVLSDHYNSLSQEKTEKKEKKRTDTLHT